MSEHSFIAFSTKIIAAAQGPPPVRPTALTPQANLLPFLTLGIAYSASLSFLPELGTYRDTRRGLPQHSCYLWPFLVVPWQRLALRASLIPTLGTWEQEGGSSGAFLG